MKLVPTEGAYQKEIECKLVRETKTLYFVSSDKFNGILKFSKKDGMRVGYGKNDFPKYKLIN